jgi:mRNA interferase RelE/StbE
MSEPPSPYRIEWASPAKRALARLPERVATAVIEFIYGLLAEAPHRVGRPLRFELEGKHSAHRGDYRVVDEIDEAEQRVIVLAIAHRADVYRPR